MTTIDATPAATPTTADPGAVTEQLAGRIFEAGVGAFELVTVLLGARLGLYRALADTPCTSAELAAATGTDERYAREWCEQQAVAGLIAVEDEHAARHERRFALLPGSAAVFLDELSPAHLVELGGFVEALGRVVPALVDAFRTGDGVPYGDYAAQHTIGALNRPAYANQLVHEWLPLVPDLDARLRAGATVAEFGCGEGWAAIALASDYPDVRVHGIDIDPPSIEAARRHAEAAGVADRVRFTVGDVAAAEGTFDAVFAFEMLHDLAHPVAALQAALRITDGPVVVMDERVADAFTAPGDMMERFCYAASVLHCLPVGRCEHDSAATGTVMRADVLRRYAAEAGFTQVAVLPIEHDMFRFYRLER
jgi:SAM-dependent methyltransferase